jgi:virginiamycin A acetyltransferase
VPTGRSFRPRDWIESAVNGLCFVMVALPALTCWLEASLDRRRLAVFQFWSHLVALLPGPPGNLVRRAFYRLTLDECARKFHVSFGVLFSHRRAAIEQGVYIGPYALIGSVRLRHGTLIGSRASLLSGGNSHQLGDDGRWLPFDADKMVQIELGPDAWVGEAAVVMANVLEGAVVAAGAVVSSAVPPRAVVGGNPARFVRMLQNPRHTSERTATHEHVEQLSRTLP